MAKASALGDPVTELSIGMRVSGHECELLVAGELDLETANDLIETATLTIDSCAVDTLVLNLGELTLADSIGVTALVRIRAAARVAGRRLYLKCPPAQLIRVLRITGIGGAFPAYPDQVDGGI